MTKEVRTNMLVLTISLYKGSIYGLAIIKIAKVDYATCQIPWGLISNSKSTQTYTAQKK